MKEPVHSVRSYVGVFAALLTLTTVTTLVAYVHLGVLNDVVALGIAAAKAALVITFFMHVRDSSPLVRVFAAAGFFWLLILFALTLADFETRIPVRPWAGG